MLKSIKEERLDRLIVRKYHNEEYNIELATFLQSHVENKEELLKAIDFINHIEFNHPGLNSLEYLVHPLRIAKIICEFDTDININTLIIALLHNVFEVSKITEKHFLSTYSKEIMEALFALKVDRSRENDIEYKSKYYSNIMSQEKGVAIVKAIDKLDNLFLLCLNPSDEIRASYLKEIENFIYPIVEKEMPSQLKYYKELVKNSRELGFLDMAKSIELYDKDYS